MFAGDRRHVFGKKKKKDRNSEEIKVSNWRTKVSESIW